MRCALAVCLACLASVWLSAQAVPSPSTGSSSSAPSLSPWTPSRLQLGPKSSGLLLRLFSTAPQPASPQDPPLYTEAQAQAAIAVAAAEAARQAVAEAVPQAVEIALKDYARREGGKLALWREIALFGLGGLVGSLLDKGSLRGAGIGAGIGALAGAAWWVVENWPRRILP